MNLTEYINKNQQYHTFKMDGKGEKYLTLKLEVKLEKSVTDAQETYNDVAAEDDWIDITSSPQERMMATFTNRSSEQLEFQKAVNLRRSTIK
jgi:hypothetical protein